MTPSTPVGRRGSRRRPCQRKSPRPAAASYELPIRAGNGTRTRDPNLGKVVLYQLSYSRVIYWRTSIPRTRNTIKPNVPALRATRPTARP